MQLVNWSGALIGPGSEWFWTMLQFVVVAGTLIGLYPAAPPQSSREATEQLGAFDVSGATSCTTTSAWRSSSRTVMV